MISLLQATLVCLSAVTSGLSTKDAQSFFLTDSPEKCRPQMNSYSIGGRSTCTFTRVLDIDSQRIPPEIPIVRCNCPGNLCSPLGDFRCQEVRESIKVSYVIAGNTSSSVTSLKTKTMEVTTACVCAASKSRKALEDGSVRTMDILTNDVG